VTSRNPYRPGVGTEPPYLADRDQQLRRFDRYLGDFPDVRRNVRLTGLRGVGKTVLLKEYRRLALKRDWVVIRRDLSGRLCNEEDFATAVSTDLQAALEEFSAVAKLKRLFSQARAAIGDLTVGFGGATVGVGSTGGARPSILEDRVRDALMKVGLIAAEHGRGVAFLYDEAHTMRDRPRKHQFPLNALVGAFVQVQDEPDRPIPVMLVLSGLPPLVNNLQAARSHSERLFRVEELGNLDLSSTAALPSKAVLALTKPVEKSAVSYDLEAADRIARDVDGYPYFIQKYGEALWDAAEASRVNVIDDSLYRSVHEQVQQMLDVEFFEGRFNDATRGDQMTLRVAGSLGGEEFDFGAVVTEIPSRQANATQQSVNRLLQGNLIYRVRHGHYAYTAPQFGNYLRRREPRQPDDR